MPGEPTSKTKKALFSLAGNTCAFPDCSTVNYDPRADTLFGEIAHIRAQQSGGPRYDAAFGEVHSLANLIVLCGVHHKLIDDHPDEFTVDRLVAMKSAHEEGSAEISGAMVDRIVGKLEASHPGMVTISINQQGGQTANVIANIGPQRRTLAGRDTAGFVERLRALGPQNVEVTDMKNDFDTEGLAQELIGVFRAAGWHVTTGWMMSSQPVRGIQLRTSAQAASESDNAVLEFLRGLEWVSSATQGRQLSHGLSLPSDQEPRLQILVGRGGP
jgi:hypothetical protein